MNDLSEQGKRVTRRRLLPLLLGCLLIPYLGQGKTKAEPGVQPEEDDEIREMLLAPDGTVVRVKRKAIRKARVLKKNVTNKTLLNWLTNK